MTVTPGIITRNGVDIYYEVRGKGPFLILIPGAQVAGNRPILVFASSNGSAPAIELLRLYPGLVRKLVLHDPILFDMLGSDSKEPANSRRVVDIYRSSGAAAASQAFLPMVTSESDREGIRASADYQQLVAMVIEGFPFFFDCEIEAILAYKTPTEFLKGCRGKICLVAGELTKTTATAEPIIALAKAIECPVSRIVGGHTGYIPYPEEFARDLSAILHRSTNVKRMAKI
ncbi:hypothetical protein ASPWEDRAFT_27736 [Aspergillus wentii DTO 134E9]|uniref:AB hydrolase-1 domain-containing protein n=1 Tax=Aspergillus wentii DTO 134E9 TaxID=1073089 RepID=A0A1L9RJI6_ASPWE|nr:uncharacterized protein ASPWEDRAFT_27736 [Aspergillus wentii DTO 134E9]OJJ35061.1 hypothetical protein ASPWEDRAFT_27736 [Aspergillus wentii DTO 134E9]